MCGGSCSGQPSWLSTSLLPRCPSIAEADRRIAHLLVPIRWSSLWSEIEQVPERFEGAHVTWVLSWVRRRIEELRGPKMADLLAVPVKDVQHRPLRPLGGLAVVVTVVGV